MTIRDWTMGLVSRVVYAMCNVMYGSLPVCLSVCTCVCYEATCTCVKHNTTFVHLLYTSRQILMLEQDSNCAMSNGHTPQ